MTYRALVVLLCTLAACSVSRNANPQYKSSSECKRLGGTPITDKFCLLGAGTPDAGTPDAATADAGRPREACSEEGAVELCYEAEDQSTAQQPPCRAGSRTCRGGFWSACDKQVLPKPETCNGSDDDCDGQVDEQLAQNACDVPDLLGACTKGIETCVAGSMQCMQVTYPHADTCNGQDDDCDGKTDEGTQLRCYPDAAGCKASSTREGNFDCTGRCETGSRACVDGAYSDNCEDSVTPDANEHCTDVGEAAVLSLIHI